MLNTTLILDISLAYLKSLSIPLIISFMISALCIKIVFYLSF